MLQKCDPQTSGKTNWFDDANLLYTQYCFGVLSINFVLDLRKLCFLSKQRCHSISVHNVFYYIFGFYEFNRLCSVQCILCVDSLVDILVHQSGTFFVIWLFDCCIDCIVFFWSKCLSVSTHCCVNKDYQIATKLRNKIVLKFYSVLHQTPFSKVFSIVYVNSMLSLKQTKPKPITSISNSSMQRFLE